MLTDEAIAERLHESSHEYRDLEDAHHQLHVQLDELQGRHVLTPQEEVMKKQLQKEKLAKKDKMAELVRQYKEREASSASR